jgi:hypothetical protein
MGLTFLETTAETDLQPRPNKRQQEKIVKSLLDNNSEVLGQYDVQEDESAKLLARKTLLDYILQGRITDQDFEKLLRSIAAPAEGNSPNKTELDDVFEKIIIDRRFRLMIASFGLGDAERESSLKAGDVQAFLKRFPDPQVWDQYKHAFLSHRKAEGSSKIDIYKKLFREFEVIFYGKRQEYWDQIKLLIAEAYDTAPVTGIEPAKAGLALKISEIQSSAGLKDRIAIRGDKYNDKPLTPDILYALGYGPKYRVEAESKVIWFSSNSFYVAGDRVVVIAYVEEGPKLIARSFYLSGSHAMLKYLVAYTPKIDLQDQMKIRHYSKTFAEESIAAPFFIQKAFVQIFKDHLPLRNPNNNLAFAGTARQVGLFQQPEGTHQHDTDQGPHLLNGNFYIEEDSDQLIPPEEVDFYDEKHRPDFSVRIDSWQSKNAIYGEYRTDIFLSNDRRYKFMFCRDTRNRAWIAGIEDNSIVVSTGTRKSWIKGGCLIIPAYDYRTNLNSRYINPADFNRDYEDMFTGYLSKIPIIKEYLAKYPN